MHAIFSDSTFGMAVDVSLCGYMKWNNLTECRKVFRFDFQSMGDLICLLLGAAIFIERALAIVLLCNDHTDKRSLVRSHC